LEGDIFRDLNRLSVLDLTGASVYNISEYAFRGLRRLRVLRLGKNALDTLPAPALQSLRQLEELYLSHNFIETIGSSALPKIAEIKIIWRWDKKKLPHGLKNIISETTGAALRNRKFNRPLSWKQKLPLLHSKPE
jgi:hypothetical protein